MRNRCSADIISTTGADEVKRTARRTAADCSGSSTTGRITTAGLGRFFIAAGAGTFLIAFFNVVFFFGASLADRTGFTAAFLGNFVAAEVLLIFALTLALTFALTFALALDLIFTLALTLDFNFYLSFRL